MSSEVWGTVSFNDPQELAAIEWQVRKNALKITAFENKLKILDPALAEWDETAQELFLAQELQKQLVYAAVIARYDHQRQQEQEKA